MTQQTTSHPDREESTSHPLTKQDGRGRWLGLAMTFLLWPSFVNSKNIGDNPNIVGVPEVSHIDVAAIIDYGLFLKFKKHNGDDETKALEDIRLYYAFIFKGADRTYFLNFQKSIRVHLIKIFVWKTREESMFGNIDTGDLDTRRALESLRDYLTDATKPVAVWGGTYDHMVVFTSMDLSKDGNSNILGATWFGQMCNSSLGGSVTILEETWGMSTQQVLVHELGHSLGANHDGEGNACPSNQMFVMMVGTAPVEGKETNQWRFSHCSKAAVNKWIVLYHTAHPNSTCMFNKEQSEDIPDVSQSQFGQTYPMQTQCRRKFGPTSDVCLHAGTSDVTKVCVLMHCSGAENVCYKTVAAEGSDCGDGGTCDQGYCVDKDGNRMDTIQPEYDDFAAQFWSYVAIVTTGSMICFGGAWAGYKFIIKRRRRSSL